MKPVDAKELALAIWSGPRAVEFERLRRIDDACRVRRPDESQALSMIMPKDAPPVMQRLAAKAPSNYLPLLVEVFRQALRVDGYLTQFPEQTPWTSWQRNRMDARQGAIHDSALKYGAAYVRVMPGMTERGENFPTVKSFTPRYCTAIYRDPEGDEWPEAAVYVDGRHLVLVDDEAEYIFGWEELGHPRWFDRRMSDALTDNWSPELAYPGTLTFIERREHGIGICPIVRYRDRIYLNGEEQYGIVEPLLQIQERIDETNFGMLVAQYFSAFRQRYVLGWVPENEAEEIKAGAARISYLNVDPEDVSLGEWSETDLTRYIASGDAARRDLSALGQVPPQVMGVGEISNISDATLAGLEIAKNRKCSEIATSFGESHEQTLRLMAHLRGHMDAATEYEGETRWAEREARSWAGTIDGLSKLVQSQIIDEETAVEKIPNFTEQQVRSAKLAAKKRRALQMRTAMQSNTPAQNEVVRKPHLPVNDDEPRDR